MSVGDAETADHHTDPQGAELILKSSAQSLSNQEDSRREILRNIEDVVDVLSGNHQALPVANRMEIQESNYILVLEHEAGGQIASDDATEGAGHDEDTGSESLGR